MRLAISDWVFEMGLIRSGSGIWEGSLDLGRDVVW